ncbi:APC family permease [Janibacter cremeus]|uniref:APC family permease n=1 Tax=Janibacter cremeus TaxID=1285192 RepID=UPI0023FA060A|nr:APC family permease [Janibacter cremeus]WEV78977.1 APC family permease [Janibacter cremeus]
MSSGQLLKRVVLGRAKRSDRLGETLLPKRIALPVFASDTLSSVAYAPDEILLTLGLAGGALAVTRSWPVALAVVAVMVVVIASYRQNVHAYHSGGGDYEIASTNLGPRAGLTVASALIVDYVLTVAVSISSGVQNAAAAFGFLEGHEVIAGLVLIAALTAVNLRGVRESGRTFAVPTYLFMLTVLGMALVAIVRRTTGTLPQAESAGLTLAPEPGYEQLGTLAMAFLVLRAFSSGCAALTGVQAISNGVPAFRTPKSRNAAATLVLMGAIAVTLFVAMIALARWTGVQIAEDPATQLLRDGEPVGEDYVQHTLMGQVSKAVFEGFPAGVFLVAVVTGLILVLAANTAFNGFPVLGSILARDGYLPSQLHTRGDRLAFSNGILLLAGAAALLITVYDASVTRLIQLYIVGVFVSFTVSQTGMVRHWNRHLAVEKDKRSRRQMLRRRALNVVGAALSGVVLLVVLVTKFAEGAGFAIAAMAAFYLLMRSIQRHYQRVRQELSVAEEDTSQQLLPSRVHAIVLVSRINKPALRAMAYAKATRPSSLEAVTVDVEAEATAALQSEWYRRGIPVPLTALDSPYRDVTRPVVEHVKSIRTGNPRDLVVVYIPQYVLGHWWEQLLHNQSALRLRSRLIFTPGVMVSSVPWQLASSEGAEEKLDRPAAGDVRRGGA